MSDEAIVGIVGILAATVLGPLIAYQIRKDEDSRSEIVRTLDGAVAALTAAAATVRWVRANLHGPGDPPILLPEIQRALGEVQVVTSYVVRLRLRLGDHTMVRAYARTESGLTFLGADVWEQFIGESGGHPEDEVAYSEAQVEQGAQEFFDAARRWHEDALGQASTQ
jgi:hypothetical protein